MSCDRCTRNGICGKWSFSLPRPFPAESHGGCCCWKSIVGTRRVFEPAVYHLHDLRVAFAIPALFLAFVSSASIVVWACRCLLGERYPEFVRYENLTAGYDGQRVVRPILVFTIVLSCCMAAASSVGTSCFAMMKSSFMPGVVCEPPHDPIRISRRFVRRPNAALPAGARRSPRIRRCSFKNGSTWSTNFAPDELDPGAKKRIADFVAQRAKQRIRELPILK